MIIQVNGDVIQPPARYFNTIIEEVLYALNVAGTPLTVNELARYFAFSPKSVSKAISKFRKHPMAEKILIQHIPGKYSVKMSKDMDIPTIVKMIKG
jgi:chromosome segregation and condensation protein ScpB